MTQGVTFPIKFVNEGNGIEVATRDMTKLETAVTKINFKFKEFGEKASKNWAEITVAISAVNQVVGTLNDHIQKAADSFNSFDKSMRAANTMAGLGEEEFGKMKDSISELGKVIPKTREELANGLYEVISNGVPEDNWLSFLEASAKASVGGIADLGQTVTVTSTIIKNYALSWEEAGNIQDKIQMAAKNGKTSFGELGAALPRVTGSAATLGVTVDELMATFATLTGVSGNTAEVSTQLSAIFTALIKPSSEAAQMAEEMGIQFDAATITAAGGMEQFLTQLKECVQEYSASSGTLETEVYGRLFGSAEAVRALIPLTGNLADKFSDNVAAMADSAGTAEGAFNQMSATGEAQSVMWRNSLASITDWIGGVLSSKAPMTDFITSAGQSVTSIMAIGTAMKALMASQAAETVAIKATTMALKAWSAVQTVLNAVLTMNPLGIVITAITALVAAVAIAYQKSDKFREICDKVWTAIKALAIVIWDALVKAFDAVTGAIKKAWNWIKKFLGIGKEDTEEQADALEDEANAADKAADAYSNLADKKEKAAGSIRVSGGAKTPAKSNGKPGKVAAPAGSIAAIDAAIQEKQAIYKTAVDAASRAAVQKELDDLEAQKRLIEFEVQLQMNGIGSIREALDFGEKLKPVDIGVNGLPALKAANVELKKVEKTVPNTTKDFSKLRRSVGNTNDTLGASGELMGAVGDIFKASNGGVENATSAWIAYGAAVMQSMSKIIAATVAAIGVKKQDTDANRKNTTSKVANAASGFFASFSEIPIVGIILALAAVAGMVATMLSLPKFAKGGIAFGPTVGMFGEYPGAANNPEVVAPLSRLKSLLGDSGNGGGEVEFRIKGRRLVGVLAKEGNVMARR